MKMNYLKGILTSLVVALAAGVATAGPLQSKDVAGEPGFVIHVDCDALKQSEVGKFILTELDKPESEKKLAAFETIFGIDPRKQLHGLTLYSSSKSSDDGVLLVYADIDAKRLTTLAEGAKEHESTKHGKHTIHGWLDESKAKKDGGKPRTYSAIHNGKVVVFSQKEGRVADALDVLDGSKPNLGTSKNFARLNSAGKSFLVGAARKLEIPNADPAAQVLKQSKMFWLSAGESDGKVELTLTLETADEETAKQVESVGRGLAGILALQKENTNAVRLSQALTIEQSKTEVVAKLTLRAADIMGMINVKKEKTAE